jgi:RHS repeat-associated protein
MKNSGISRHGIGRLLLMLGQETWMDIKVLKRQGLSQRAIARETPGKTYNSDNQRSNTGFSYDGNGNPTTYSTNAAVFDVENRMSSYGSSFTAGYDSLDIRAWSKSGSTTTYYLYADNPTLPVCELNSSGSVMATNTDTINGLVSRNTSSGTTFYEFDPQGTVAERLNSAGSCTVSSVADASGGIANSGTVSDPFGYVAQAGYYTDQQTGLIMTTFRYYDPANGRYINRDPSSYEGGVDLYNYTQNNWETQIDPSGNLAIVLIGVVALDPVVLIAIGVGVIIIGGVYILNHTSEPINEADRDGNNLNIGRRISEREAVNRIPNGQDIYTRGWNCAKRITKKAGTGKVIDDPPHGPGYYPHFNPNPRNGGHGFYGDPLEEPR